MLFNFKGLNGCQSQCELDIRDCGTHVLVIAKELSSNPGTSVTNAWPKLADDISKQFGNFDGKEVIWIEHYPRNHNETWDLVRMVRTPKGWQMSTAEHPWKALTIAQVERLIKGERISDSRS